MSGSDHQDADVIVIGGGIIGVAISAALPDHRVIVLDSGEPRFGTSMANAGHIVVSHAAPFAAPGMVRMGLRSLMARDGSFALSRNFPVSGISWLAKFAAHCTTGNVETLTPGMLSVLRNSAAAVRQLGIPVTPTHVWEVFTSPHAERDCVREFEHLQHLGVSSRLIPTDVVRDSESILTKSACAVVELQEDFGLDPELLWRTLGDLNPHSTLIGNTTVDSITPVRSGSSVIVQAGDQTFTATKVVIAAGAWTPGLTRKLGLKLPIVAAKGYSITIEHPEHNAVHPMILADEKTAIDPIGDSLRLSARFELTRPDDRSVDHKRIRQIYARAQSALKLPPIPDSLDSLSPWTGVRPASADGAPFIGPLAQFPNILVAAGHGMIGTTMAMGTAELIARYVRQDEVSMAERALTPNR